MEIQGYDNLIFFDTETTGFDGQKNRIIELAAVQVNGSTEKQIDKFIKLPEGESVPDNIVKLTGITDKILSEEGVSEIEACAEFAELFTGKTLLVAHNAQFDLNFIGYTFWRNRHEHLEWIRAFNAADYLDTLTVFKDRRSYPHKLQNAIDTYKLGDKVQNTHRAIDDCLALYEVTKAMQAERNDLESYINIFGYNSKYGISGSTITKVTYRQQGYSDFMREPQYTLPAVIKRERK